MKKWLFFLGIFCSVSVYGASKPITFVYEVKENPPFYLGNGTDIDWHKPGITLEVLALVAKNLQLNFHFVRVPWARGIFMVRRNLADGIFHASYKESRKAVGVYPTINGLPDPERRINSQSYYLYRLKSSPLSWDGRTISSKGEAIGAVLAYAIVEDLKSMGVKVEEVLSQHNGLEMLLRGRIGGWADLGSMTDAYIRSNSERYSAIEKITPPLIDRPYYLLFSHQFVMENPQTAEAIWNEIKAVRESGVYDQIAANYMESDIQ